MRTRKRRRKERIQDDSHELIRKAKRNFYTCQESCSCFGCSRETTTTTTIMNCPTTQRLNLVKVSSTRHSKRHYFTLLLYLLTSCVIFYNLNQEDLSTTHSKYTSNLFLPVACQKPAKLLQQQQQQHSSFLSPNLPELIAQQGGILKDKNVTLNKQFNPIVITKDIVIRKGAKLTIEPGTELLFSKRKGIIVYGTLEILGTLNDKVKLNLLKSQQSATVNFRSQINNHLKSHQLVRLVDGELPNEGRVQINLNDRWHSLCTNSKNLTSADIKLICQQVGYQDGSWYKWFSRRNETTLQMMSKSFHCSGSETAITQCKRWNRIRTGGGVCDYHSDIGVRCSKTLNAAYEDYWRGLEFVNSETGHEYILDGQMKQKLSKSSLNHLTISEAGLNEVGNATAAIRVYGQPPRLNDIEVKHSIYGIMIEDVDDAFQMSNIRIHNNMANPLFVNTSWGKVSMDNIVVENNAGDGIRFARHEKIQLGSHDFCKFANLGASQSFPVVLSHEQTFFTSGRDCCQEFISNNQLTVHFPVLRSTPNNLLPEVDNNRRISIPEGVSIGKDANLVIYDDYRDEFPFRLRIQNGTRAQSIVSKSGRLKVCYESAVYRTVLFTIQVVADNPDHWTGIASDLELTNSIVRSNQGRGVWVENPRSGIKLINTTILNHNYLAGLHVENGTGEVIVQASNISNNIGQGILIDLAGGYYHIDNSTISDNSLRGISIVYDKRAELVPFNHTVHVSYSLIARNGEQGLFIGNVCRSDAFWNVSMNSFIKNEEDAILFQSCQPSQETIFNFKNLTSRLNLTDPDMIFHNNYQELFITHNSFLDNSRRAINLNEVFFLKSFIRHNLFKEHQLAVLNIRNRLPFSADFEDLSLAPVNIRVASNRFYFNRGRYVANLGVQEDNPKHSLIFTKNTLEENTISEPYNELKPRSRVSAVVVVSSSNTKVIRNRFNNPQSSFELGSHLEAHSKIINATANFWGYSLDAASIYRRIFDRKNRYNLAQVEFLQYLLSPEDLEYATDFSFDRERDKIITFRNGLKLGGEIKGNEELQPNTYLVHDDLYLRPGSHLILRPGTVLKFNDGVGMMVQGRLDALGNQDSHIMFTSSNAANRSPQRQLITTTPAPLANPWVSHQSLSELDDDLDNPANISSISHHRRAGRIIKKRQAASSLASNVRLSHVTMGRLEVNIDGSWGSVCDYNFDIDDAAVVCQQLGMILNKDDWLLEKFQYAANDQQQISMMSNSVLMTNLRCDPTLDVDITRCKAELSSRGDFDGLCNSEVGIRCFPPSWSGVRLGMGADTSTLEHVVIQRAGMFDYANYMLRPALQVDLNRHLMSNLVVKSNSDSGLGIIWNDVIGRHFSELSIAESKFLNNERHGIELKSKGLSIKSCSMSNNRQNGLDYNPTLSQLELCDLLSWLHTPKNSENIVHLTFPLQARYFSVPSAEDSYRFFVFPRNPPKNLKESFTIATDPGHMLSIHLMNPIHPESSENLNMSVGINPELPIVDFSVNMTSMPMISPGYKFHFNYSTGQKPRGFVVLYIRTRYNNRDLKLLNRFIPPHLIMPKFDLTAANINAKLINSIVVSNSNITRNGIGLKFTHSNYFYNSRADYNLRFANETTNITGNLFDNNHFSSIFVGSNDFESNFDSTAINKSIPGSEIYYNVWNNKFRRNRDGIRQQSRDIRQSNNVFHWSINDSMFEFDRGGGISIILPYYWRYDSNLSHTIEVNNNNFTKNSNFEFLIDGHFAALNVTRNSFKENKCKNSLIYFGGMEKRMLFRYNIIEQNICNRILDLNIQSHADKLDQVTALIEFNSFRSNRRLSQNSTSSSSNLISDKLDGQRLSRLISTRLNPHASDYALNLEGVQPVELTRNLLVNPELRFEMVVAISLNPNEMMVKAAENFWGSVILADIKERIFDFDDWNSYALAQINPYLTQDSFSAATIIGEWSTSIVRPLGGRITQSMRLKARKEPYLVESDLTIMPGVNLTIERGAVLEFVPHVGILVLGDLIAVGTRDRPIVMRPLLSARDVPVYHQQLFRSKPKPNIIQLDLNDPLSYEQSYALRHYHFAYPIDMGSVRLCKNEICNDGSHIYENNVEDQTLRQEVLRSSSNSWKLDGFLEIFNMTTLQWVPVCDPLFTEHTARVVCRQLGYSHLSIHRRGRRYTLEQEQVMSIRHWPQSILCEGDETSLASCPLALTGFTNHSAACTRESNQFIYLHCSDFPETSSTAAKNHGSTNELVHHWGGIRFSCPSPSTSANQQDTRDTYSSLVQQASATRSRLQYVSIERAGMLHRKRSPAVQVLQCSVQIEYVAITNSAHHGLEIITSQGNQNFHQLRLGNNLGVGLNYLSLTGSSSASRLVPYLPLKQLDISSDILDLVSICGANKHIQIQERILLFYRYSSQPVDCVKIISSKLHIKHIGIRMLQFNLFNSTAFTSRPDSIRVYDGNIFDRDSRLLVDLGVTEKHRQDRPELKFYQTTDNTMTIRLHVSGASHTHGFIAEVVTTPVSYNIQRDTYNNFTFSELNNNKGGALVVSSAGESSPNLIVKNNRIESNCMYLFGNFTSCSSAIYMELQNCQRLQLVNNLIKNNQGGLMIKSYSQSAVSALDASIENNVFEANQNNNILALLGPKTDPYQTVRVSKNFFTRNYAAYTPNIVLSRIVANFSYNIITGNVGKHQIVVLGFNKLPLSYQTFVGNWIYNNTATYESDRSTIFGNTAGQQYLMNYLVNPDNYFEISTLNWSRYEVKPFHTPHDEEIIHLESGDGSSRDIMRKTVDAIPISIVDTKKLDLYHATINAKQNWWGFNNPFAIQGRIRDRVQHSELLKVDFVPFLEANRSVLSDVCAGGWQRVGDACLVYIGSRMTYQEATEFCERERATLPLMKGNHDEFTEFIASREHEFDSLVERVWVRSFDVPRAACPALNDYRTRKYDCQDKYAFLCEKDPQIVVSLLYWHMETGGVIALIIALITMVLTLCCTVCWGYKSRHRYREKLERKNSIYASMRSNRGPYSSNNSLSELFLHRQIYNTDKSSITNLSLSTQMTQPSNDESNQVRLDPSYSSGAAAAMNSKSRHDNNLNSARQISTSRSQLPEPPLPPKVPLKPRYSPQPATNPDYVSPSPVSHRSNRSNRSTSLYRDPPRVASSNSSYNGSKTPSFAGSYQADQVEIDPMPQLAAPAYSQLDHLLSSANGLSAPPTYSAHSDRSYRVQPAASTDKQQQQLYHNGTQMIRDIDGSESSVPTYYSNQIETYEDSTQSFIEAYNEAYNKTLQTLKSSQRTTSYSLSQKTSIPDLFLNSSQQLTQASTLTADSRANSMLMRPLIADPAQDNNNQLHRAQSTRNFSDQNRYCVETSLDFDDAPATASEPPRPSLGASQRLSPVSSSYYAPQDSKHGSRVYLETSFE